MIEANTIEGTTISAAFPYQKQRRRVLGREMAYVEVGKGDPIVLLHGNPTSSYLWRNVLPHLRPRGRDHWDKMGMRRALEALRTEAGETMVLQNNYFIEEILPNAILRRLSDEEMAAYRRPFAEPGEGRRPTLTWPRQIPIDGEPADVAAIAAAYADWLATSGVPKLFVKAEPGGILASRAMVDFVRKWPAQDEVKVAGVHFVQEDSPDEIGRAIAGWMGTLSRARARKAGSFR